MCNFKLKRLNIILLKIPNVYHKISYFINYSMLMSLIIFRFYTYDFNESTEFNITERVA